MQDEPLIGNYVLSLEEPPVEQRHLLWIKAGERDGAWAYDGSFKWSGVEWVEVEPVALDGQDRSAW